MERYLKTKFEKFNENTDTNYEKMYNTILEYIEIVKQSDLQISTLSVKGTRRLLFDTFKKVLIYLELQNMYEKEFNSTSSDIDILNALFEGEYFDQEKLENNKEEEIIRVYRKLSEKKDKVRNQLILAPIELKPLLMPHLSYHDLKSHKITL